MHCTINLAECTSHFKVCVCKAENAEYIAVMRWLRIVCASPDSSPFSWKQFRSNLETSNIFNFTFAPHKILANLNDIQTSGVSSGMDELITLHRNAHFFNFSNLISHENILWKLRSLHFNGIINCALFLRPLQLIQVIQILFRRVALNSEMRVDFC